MNALHLEDAPGDRLTLPGGRQARTPAEVRYVRALQIHAERRRDLGNATASLMKVRSELLATVALSGPAHFTVNHVRERHARARASVTACAQAADVACDEVLAALDAWALEAAP